jgi:dihydropteroate synthase
MQQLLNQQRPLIMGVLNVTPDSFSDGGRYASQALLQARIQQMVDDGADIIDIGGESTRPGALSVGLQQELDRVMPAIEAVRAMTNCPISIDTYKPEVMRQAIHAGVSMVNDVNALQAEGALSVVVKSDVLVCLMHKQGAPNSMQLAPSYRCVVNEVKDFLVSRIEVCLQEGIEPGRIIIDPGFGFGKTLSHNIALFKQLSDFKSIGIPILVGLSRKSMLGQLLNDLPVEQRGLPSVVVSLMAIQQGAKIVRVHDIKEMKQAMMLYEALSNHVEGV